MTELKKDTIKLLERMPEEKVYYVFQILQGIDSLFSNEDVLLKQEAYDRLERTRKSIPDLDYDKELMDYREARYGTASID